MIKNTALSEKIQGFADREIAGSTQKVMPVESAASPKEEQQLNVWIPKDLMKRLKFKGAEVDKSLKEMVTEAIEQFL